MVRVYDGLGFMLGLGLGLTFRAMETARPREMRRLLHWGGLSSRAMETARPRAMRPLPPWAGLTFRDMETARPREMRPLPLGRGVLLGQWGPRGRAKLAPYPIAQGLRRALWRPRVCAKCDPNPAGGSAAPMAFPARGEIARAVISDVAGIPPFIGRRARGPPPSPSNGSANRGRKDSTGRAGGAA